MSVSKTIRAPLLGAVAGSIITAIAGFTVGGWMTTSKAEAVASAQSAAAVVSVLAPMCARSFKGGADRGAQLAELKTKSAYEQEAFVAKGGWANIPGTTQSRGGVARACAEMILSEK